AARLMGTRHGSIGAVILVAMALIAVFAGLIAPYAPLQQTADSLAEPSAQYLFGTDNIGRDIFSLVVHGARSSLLVGLGA
ncbi:ABC transporter permease, partial [Streptomyces europaeiscabiei]